MTDLTEILAYGFIQRAVIAGLMISVLCGILGTFIVIKRLVFISGGISHAAFGGLGVFYFLGWPPIFGAYLVALVSALILGSANREKLVTQTSLIGVIWAVGMAIGILFISKTPGYSPNLMTYLFGNILSITSTDLITLLVMDTIVIVVMILLFKEIVAIGFDEEYAFVQGVPVKIIMTIFLLLISITIVTLIQMVGIILVIALLTIPTLFSLLFMRGFKAVIISSVIVSIFIIMLGLGGSYYLDLPTGPVIIVFGTLILGLGAMARRLLARRH